MTKKPKRNKAKEEAYQERPEQVHKRVLRNKARRLMEKKGLVHKGDGKDVDHKKMLAEGGSGSPRNLRVVDRSTNRKKQPAHKGAALRRQQRKK
jgi:hypothetical protein